MALTLIVKDETGKTVHTEALQTRDSANPFSSGKTGYGAYGKVNFGSDRFQMSFNLVKIAAK